MEFHKTNQYNDIITRLLARKKKTNKKICKKAVTYTLATFASLAVATLVGYGIVNKGARRKKLLMVRRKVRVRLQEILSP
ncbi:MAG: hypothetical protein L6V95_01840 [Candidatus Melainabacteria bacterium]|nr:MAG: hypothetical protein L6V95_01840 [Candidatus Melainabacteria bacterium]